MNACLLIGWAKLHNQYQAVEYDFFFFARTIPNIQDIDGKFLQKLIEEIKFIKNSGQLLSFHNFATNW